MGPRLRIKALGVTAVECSEGIVKQEWLMQRPGQLLKYLVCHRDEVVSADECIEALWPETVGAGRTSLRQAVFSLRQMLEPNRRTRGESSFVLTLGGGYALNRHRVEVDIDGFEALVTSGPPDVGPSVESLELAMELYQGDLFSEEHYADWAFAETQRLRELADWALRLLAIARLTAGDLHAAEQTVLRLAVMWPLDPHPHRALVAICIARGHWSGASRWYALYRRRLLRVLGTEPDFTLTDLAPAPVSAAIDAVRMALELDRGGRAP